jgi:hypothetical protein
MTIRVSIKPQKTAISSINIGPRQTISLGQLTNVDASNPDNNEALIFDADSNSFVVKPIVVDSNNITNLAGGTF